METMDPHHAMILLVGPTFHSIVENTFNLNCKNKKKESIA
jgi:hypothetical protein